MGGSLEACRCLLPPCQPRADSGWGGGEAGAERAPLQREEGWGWGGGGGRRGVKLCALTGNLGLAARSPSLPLGQRAPSGHPSGPPPAAPPPRELRSAHAAERGLGPHFPPIASHVPPFQLRKVLCPEFVNLVTDMANR